MWSPDPNIKYDEYDPHIPMPGELSAEELEKLEEGHEERMRIILESSKKFRDASEQKNKAPPRR